MSSDEPSKARFAKIVATYEKELSQFLSHYMPNKADVEDCVQETLLNIWRQEQRGLLREDARGYLFTVALNVVRDFWRRDRVRHRKAHVELSEDLPEMRRMGMDKQVAEREGIRLIEASLEQLKPSTKAAFLLYHVENLTPDQIAVRLGVSARTVEREMARALEYFRSTLGGVVKDLLEE
ncbi:MAG: sigma-70 family RNA polymerase sigma factor [Rhodospirillaceae bacterium]|nr:sigma-70 family RNA polymerase sigma factor [Rhodospirillaceae bacterium]